MSNKGQVPEYSKVKELQSIVEKAKKEYLLELIKLGYVLEKQGSYSDTAYWAIHPECYLTEDEFWDKDDFYIDGKISPEFYPPGAFIRIDSIAESETEDPWETQYLLSEDRCYLDYLGGFTV